MNKSLKYRITKWKNYEIKMKKKQSNKTSLKTKSYIII